MRSARQPFLTRLTRPRTLMVLGGLVIFGIGSGLIKLVMQNNTVEADIARLEQEAAALEGRNGEIMELLRRFETTGFLEREARLKLNLQKPGEKVVVVEQVDGGELGNATPVVRIKAPNWKRWWWYFFDPPQLAQATVE